MLLVRLVLPVPIRSLSLNAIRNNTSPLQILSRTKAAAVEPESIVAAKAKKKKHLPKLDDLLAKRDYVGAITFLEVCEHALHHLLSGTYSFILLLAIYL